MRLRIENDDVVGVGPTCLLKIIRFAGKSRHTVFLPGSGFIADVQKLCDAASLLQTCAAPSPKSAGRLNNGESLFGEDKKVERMSEAGHAEDPDFLVRASTRK
jgi:hypothetical protein